MTKLTKVRNNGWLHDSGMYVAKFNFAYLVYESKQAYQTAGADYVSFQTIKDDSYKSQRFRICKKW